MILCRGCTGDKNVPNTKVFMSKLTEAIGSCAVFSALHRQDRNSPGLWSVR